MQLPISGCIELSTPQCPEMQRIDRRHLLIVCPGSWSPRTNHTARNHLAIGLNQMVTIHEFVTPARAPGRAVKQTQLTAGTGPLAAVIEAIRQCLHARPNPAVLHALVLAALPLLAQALQQPEDGLGQAIEAYLAEHCYEALTRDRVAAVFGISGDHLNRTLKQSGRLGFVPLMHHLRIAMARQQLMRNELSLNAIANNCGFGSTSYLIRVFRRQMGCTPDQWRRSQRSSAA